MLVFALVIVGVRYRSPPTYYALAQFRFVRALLGFAKPTHPNQQFGLVFAWRCWIGRFLPIAMQCSGYGVRGLLIFSQSVFYDFWVFSCVSLSEMVDYVILVKGFRAVQWGRYFGSAFWYVPTLAIKLSVLLYEVGAYATTFAVTTTLSWVQPFANHRCVTPVSPCSEAVTTADVHWLAG